MWDFLRRYILGRQNPPVLINDKQVEEITSHSQSHSALLNTYAESVSKNLKTKIFLKKVFFIITMSILIAIAYWFYLSLQFIFDSFDKFNSLNDISIEAILSMVTIILPSISSLIIAFIKIPETIAQYLFNAEEDNYMDSVIKNIQDYDKAIFELEYKLREILRDNKDQSIEGQDEEIEDSPIEDGASLIRKTP